VCGVHPTRLIGVRFKQLKVIKSKSCKTRDIKKTEERKMIKKCFFWGLICLCQYFLLFQSVNSSQNDKIIVKKFKLTGNVIFKTEELLPLVRNYEGRVITLEELQEVKNKLTQYYLDKDYLTAIVTIPDQVINNDVVTLEIIELYPQPKQNDY
jgi:hemolysin activation/secretion protein